MEGASYTFELRQPSPPTHGIGFWIMNADDATSRKTTLTKVDLVDKPKFKKAELVSLTLQLPPRPNGLPYIVVVSTFEPQQLATFTLSVASAEDPAAKLVPLDPAVCSLDEDARCSCSRAVCARSMPMHRYLLVRVRSRGLRNQ